jgi:hypothetical protein
VLSGLWTQRRSVQSSIGRHLHLLLLFAALALSSRRGKLIPRPPPHTSESLLRSSARLTGWACTTIYYPSTPTADLS